MEPGGVGLPAAEPASLVIVDPNGHRSRVALDPLPFRIGRQPGNELVLHDGRVSRAHARIVSEGGTYVLEDCASRHGTAWLSRIWLAQAPPRRRTKSRNRNSV